MTVSGVFSNLKVNECYESVCVVEEIVVSVHSCGTCLLYSNA